MRQKKRAEIPLFYSQIYKAHSLIRAISTDTQLVARTLLNICLEPTSLKQKNVLTRKNKSAVVANALNKGLAEQ